MCLFGEQLTLPARIVNGKTFLLLLRKFHQEHRWPVSGHRAPRGMVGLERFPGAMFGAGRSVRRFPSGSSECVMRTPRGCHVAVETTRGEACRGAAASACACAACNAMWYNGGLEGSSEANGDRWAMQCEAIASLDVSGVVVLKRCTGRCLQMWLCA